MKVYLTSDVKNVGHKGALVSVADGFGRNFLLARGLASLRPVAVAPRRQPAVLSGANRELLQQLTLAVSAQANEHGTLYQGVTAETISRILKEQHQLKIPADLIQLPSPIKSVGPFTITVVDHGRTIATVTGEVTPRPL
jgi:large subunit ribosomal protein L9